MSGTRVLYVESREPDAQASLLRLLDALREEPGYAGAELLTSPDQPGLALLASRWAGVPPSVSLPGKARAWTFDVAHHDP